MKHLFTLLFVFIILPVVLSAQNKPQIVTYNIGNSNIFIKDIKADSDNGIWIAQSGTQSTGNTFWV